MVCVLQEISPLDEFQENHINQPNKTLYNNDSSISPGKIIDTEDTFGKGG